MSTRVTLMAINVNKTPKISKMPIIRFYCTLAVLLSFSVCSNAQTTYAIKGQVVDSTGTGIEFGNLVVLSPTDSSLLKGVHIWNGEFELFGIEQQEFIVKITAPGLSPYYQKQTLTDTSLTDLGTIVLENANLDVIEVVHYVSMFQREVGKLVVNVEGTMLAEKGTIKDLLKSTPNVLVKGNQVVVVGKGPAILYLDGQRVFSLEMISSISATDVHKIEVITNPSSKYDAEGNAVIEIITKTGAKNGYQASLGLRGMKRTESQFAYWANLSFKKDWFTMYASYGQYKGTIYEDEFYFREVFGTPKITMENDVLRAINNKLNNWMYLDTDFQLDSVSTLFLSYTGSISQKEETTDNINRLFADSIYAGELVSTSFEQPKKNMHSISGGYVRKLDSLGSEFSAVGQFTNFDFNSKGTIDQTSIFASSVLNQFRSDNYNDIRMISGQIDYNKNFNERINLAIGAKNGYVTNASGIDLLSLQGSTWVSDSSFYNEFDYTENVSAAYAEIRGRLNKFSYSSGLRYEWTNVEGNSYVAGTGIVSQSYHNLFPNVQMNYDFTPDLIMGLSYINRIQRPSFTDLDPFISFVDSLTSFSGNPKLQPSYAHNLEMNLAYMEYASITLGYSKAFNPMYLTVIQNPGTNTFSALTQNIQSSETYSIGLVIPYEWPWWTTFNAFGYSWNNFKIVDDATTVLNNEPTWYVSLWNEFRFKKICTIELSYEYVSPGSQGFFNAKSYQSFGGSISRAFLKDALSVRFSVFDLFKQEIERAESALPSFNVSYRSWADTRSFMLTLIYQFGKLKDNSMEAKSIDSDVKDRARD